MNIFSQEIECYDAAKILSVAPSQIASVLDGAGYIFQGQYDENGLEVMEARNEPTVTFIEVTVGSLRAGYDKPTHDHWLEAIEELWQGVFPDVEVRVDYGYQSDETSVRAFNEDGDVVFECEQNLKFAFKNNKWQGPLSVYGTGAMAMYVT